MAITAPCALDLLLLLLRIRSRSRLLHLISYKHLLLRQTGVKTRKTPGPACLCMEEGWNTFFYATVWATHPTCQRGSFLNTLDKPPQRTPFLTNMIDVGCMHRSGPSDERASTFDNKTHRKKGSNSRCPSSASCAPDCLSCC